MEQPDFPDTLLTLFDAPAARCNPDGMVAACNSAFERWASAGVGARLEIQGSRGVLLGISPPRALVLAPLVAGGWLVLPASAEAPGTLAAVATAVAARLERVETSLEANAEAGLLEQPSDAVASCLRETLAVSEELRVLRLQVAALGASAPTQRGPMCLRVLLHDAAAALPGCSVKVDAADGDFTIEVDRARLFPLLVGLVVELAQESRSPVRADLRGGDFVRLRFCSDGLPDSLTPGMDAARRFVQDAGGRILLEPGVALTLEFPAYARGFRAVGGHGTVLIVDDDESALAMMTAVLRRAGFQVLSAGNGVVASMLWRKHLHEIVAIVADAVLPGRSGVELAAEARRSVPQLPVLLVSGHSSDLLGASDVNDLPILSKPFGARTLADRVRLMVTGEG